MKACDLQIGDLIEYDRCWYLITNISIAPIHISNIPTLHIHGFIFKRNIVNLFWCVEENQELGKETRYSATKIYRDGVSL